jgi:hypothetical protein
VNISTFMHMVASLDFVRSKHFQTSGLLFTSAQCLSSKMDCVYWRIKLCILLCMQVPVGKAGAWCPVNRSVPRESFLAFYSKLSSPPSKEIAKSIVRMTP